MCVSLPWHIIEEYQFLFVSMSDVSKISIKLALTLRPLIEKVVTNKYLMQNWPYLSNI